MIELTSALRLFTSLMSASKSGRAEAGESVEASVLVVAMLLLLSGAGQVMRGSLR
jgi:hypothetical protein